MAIKTLEQLQNALSYYVIDADYCSSKGYSLQQVVGGLKEDILSHQPDIFSDEPYIRDIEIINNLTTNN